MFSLVPLVMAGVFQSAFRENQPGLPSGFPWCEGNGMWIMTSADIGAGKTLCDSPALTRIDTPSAKRHCHFVDFGGHVDFEAMLGKADHTVKTVIHEFAASCKG
ncbi:hypothetical protein [Ralstonia solanacearum]|uniref:hypothetical protein n=1 Tax=Ralstonia solanacearum TaxID=305 RepID=UPI000F60E23A|nr:hypothetical protein [Ralstonia solanacearum]MBB6585726.1 hypothetical protein [Ralstonia solanacearum]MCG3573583.1 hypothetical protein [Ralstonia solanacearum]MCL9824718.1 hypothetical protein [Ralstonia solanacearum]MCL9829906.1 hypothetical protein [Ralstonia solanacearum]MCL9834687.1 hypothetical protein [Ralstonia solanacearum]